MPKDFHFRLVLDRFGNAYFIPIVEKKNSNGDIYYDLGYKITDIVESASGNLKKQKMIDDCHNKLKNDYLNHYVMEDKEKSLYECITIKVVAGK